MTYLMGNATVPASSTVSIFNVPPSYVNVTFYNINTSATNVYIGTSTVVSSASGLVCHSIPVTFTSFIGSRGATFYATTGGAAASSVNYIICTDQ